MRKVTIPAGERSLAFHGASAVAAMIDLFGLFVLLGMALKVASPLLSPAVHETLAGVAAIASFGYALVAHRGWLASLGRWCIDIERYTYAQVEEYVGKGALLVHGVATPKQRAIRTVCTVIVIYIVAAVAGGG